MREIGRLRLRPRGRRRALVEHLVERCHHRHHLAREIALDPAGGAAAHGGDGAGEVPQRLQADADLDRRAEQQDEAEQRQRQGEHMVEACRQRRHLGDGKRYRGTDRPLGCRREPDPPLDHLDAADARQIDLVRYEGAQHRRLG